MIDRLSSRVTYQSPRMKLGIGDDCAVYSVKTGIPLLLTADALVEKVHFDMGTTSAKQLGRKAMAVNISDIAAMGGVPTAALICLGIPPTLPVKFLDGLYSGINQMCQKYRIQLAGGDTVSSPKHLFINITLLGEAPDNRPVTRAGARPGDAIFVTGFPGESALGLKILRSRRRNWAGTKHSRQQLIQAHLDPVPRLAESRRLMQSRVRVTSMIDTSDGLIQDLYQICQAGKVGAVLWEKQIPKSPRLTRFCSDNRLISLDFMLSGGEDYELLFTLKSEDVRKLIKQFQYAKTPVTQIGEVSSKSGKIELVRNNDRRETLQKSMGFDHFKTKGR
ncbi:MAG: thiamine-phosphate kinase [Nitrospinaceae bacterium]